MNTRCFNWFDCCLWYGLQKMLYKLISCFRLKRYIQKINLTSISNWTISHRESRKNRFLRNFYFITVMNYHPKTNLVESNWRTIGKKFICHCSQEMSYCVKWTLHMHLISPILVSRLFNDLELMTFLLRFLSKSISVIVYRSKK